MSVLIHPITTVLPPSCLVLCLLAEVASLVRIHSSIGIEISKFRVALLSLAVVFSLVSYFSGIADFSQLPVQLPEVQSAAMRHQSLAQFYLFFLTATLGVAVWCLNSVSHKQAIWLYRALLVICLVLIFLVGSAGASLVFEHGLGVRR